jgi:hypothetical protein
MCRLRGVALGWVKGKWAGADATGSLGQIAAALVEVGGGCFDRKALVIGGLWGVWRWGNCVGRGI